MNKFLISLLSISIIISCNNNKPGEQKNIKEENKTTEKTDTGNKVNLENTNKDETKLNPGNAISTGAIPENGWTTSDETTFLSPCIQNATKNVGPERANVYCNCMLQKLKIKFKNYQEAQQQFQNAELDIKRMADECNSQ